MPQGAPVSFQEVLRATVKIFWIICLGDLILAEENFVLGASRRQAKEFLNLTELVKLTTKTRPVERNSPGLTPAGLVVKQAGALDSFRKENQNGS
jgi:hypothetical protein